MIISHNIPWKLRSIKIQRDLFFIENNKVYSGNLLHNTKKLFVTSPLFQKLHSIIVYDQVIPILWLSDSSTNNILEINKNVVKKLNVSGDILKNPQGFIYDKIKKIFYICDTNNHRICSLNQVDGKVTTIVGGSSRKSGYKDGKGKDVLFNKPSGICFGKTNNFLYITDTGNHVIRVVNISQSYETKTLGKHQTRNPQVSDGLSIYSMFREPYDIINHNKQSVIICEKYGNLRELNLDTQIVRTIHLSHKLKYSGTRIFPLQEKQSVNLLLLNNGEWYHIKGENKTGKVCPQTEKQIHHHGIYFDKYNNNRIIRQPYSFSYYSPRDPLKLQTFSNTWWEDKALLSQYDYHQAIQGNHIPYLSDSQIQGNMTDVFLHPHIKTPKMLYLEMKFLRKPDSDSGYSYLIQTNFGYEGRIKIKHNGFLYPKTHIIRLKKVKGNWTVYIYPKLDDPQKLELLGGPSGMFESNNVFHNKVGQWEDNSTLIGNIHQWSVTQNENFTRNKPLTNLYELTCNKNNQCSYSHLQGAPECCVKGKQGDACRQVSKQTPKFQEKGVCKCPNGTITSCPIMDGQSKSIQWNTCEKCNPGYEKRKSGICTKKCSCKNGIPAKNEMCYFPGREICSECHPGFRMQSDNTCLQIKNYTGNLKKLSDKPYQIKQRDWGKNYFQWNILQKTYIGKGWEETSLKPNECFKKSGRVDMRKSIQNKRQPLFTKECWNIDSKDPCYQSIVSKVKKTDPLSSEFQKEQCNQSINPTSPCYQKTPCQTHLMKQQTGCLSPQNKMSILKPLHKTHQYTDFDLLGKTQWVVEEGKQKKQGYEIELFIKDYHPGTEIKQANNLCNQTFYPLTVNQLNVSGLDKPKCSQDEILGNGNYKRKSETNNQVLFTNKWGYEISLSKSDPCLSSKFGTKCLKNQITYQGKSIAKCSQPTIVSYSINKQDCQSCSHWSYINETNKHTQSDIDQAVYNYSTSSIIHAIHIRLINSKTIPKNNCQNNSLIKQIIEGDFIKKSLFETTQNITHAKGLFPLGPKHGTYNRSHERGIQMILSEGPDYFFEKKLIFRKDILCNKITIPKNTVIIIRIYYCSNNHWEIKSFSKQNIIITGDIWDPNETRFPPTTCKIKDRQRNPKQMRSITNPMKKSHIINLKVKQGNNQFINIQSDAIQTADLSAEIEICEPELIFVMPKINRTNKQVTDELIKFKVYDKLGFYSKRNNNYYLLNPYSVNDGTLLQNQSNFHTIYLYRPSQCNLITSQIYQSDLDDECKQLELSDINQIRQTNETNCLQRWGSAVKVQNNLLFQKGKWTPFSKPYQPNVSDGETCCTPQSQKNELLCIEKSNKHKYVTCKPGFHPVDVNEYKTKKDKSTDHSNDNHCQFHKCICIPNICTCSQKKPPKKGMNCVIHGSESCDDGCSKYQRLHNQSCVPNICQCNVSLETNETIPGWKRTGKLLRKSFPKLATKQCLVHNSESCEKCPPGFYNKQNKCYPYKGNCKHGTLISQLKRVKDNQCEKCNTGYELIKQLKGGTKVSGNPINCSNLTKTDNPCSCLTKPCRNIRPPPNGKMGDCLSTLQSGKDCKFKCDSGYSLSGVSICNKGIFKPSSCMINNCICQSGIGMKGPGCLKDKENICRSCNPGYKLTNKKTCMPYMGTCKNGQLIEQSKRTKDNHCSKCNEGYYLSKNVCNKFQVCPSGNELLGWSEGTPQKDGLPGKCSPCKAGTFKTIKGTFRTKCQKQPPKCSSGQYEKIKGNTKTKRICETRRSCVYPQKTDGYIIDKNSSNIIISKENPFRVSVSCDTNKNYKPDKDMGALPCSNNKSVISLYGCKRWCPITQSQYANTGTCKDSLKSGTSCEFVCQKGTCPVNLKSSHRCEDGRLKAGKCSKNACKKLMDLKQKLIEQEKEEQEEIINKIKEEKNFRTQNRIAPPPPSGASSTPKEVIVKR